MQNASGITLAESEAWSLASEQLYVLCWKIDIEDQRRNSEISGYEWWLIQDYWMGNNGVLDTFQVRLLTCSSRLLACSSRLLACSSRLLACSSRLLAC